MTLPTNEQELFEFAIDQRVSVIHEFGSRDQLLELAKWAIDFAPKHGLVAPTDPEKYGLYYTPDEDEIIGLKAKGLWVEELDWEGL